jgi:hypothetical protein
MVTLHPLQAFTVLPKAAWVDTYRMMLKTGGVTALTSEPRTCGEPLQRTFPQAAGPAWL